MRLGRHLDIKGKGAMETFPWNEQLIVTLTATSFMTNATSMIVDTSALIAILCNAPRALFLCDGSIIRTFDGARRTGCLRLQKMN